MPLEKYDDFLELTVKQLVIKPALISVTQIIFGV